MNTQFWQTITPVKGEPIPDGAMWRTNSQSLHWHSPPNENWTAFTNNMLEWQWRVPREVVPLDLAVDAVMQNCFEVNGEGYWMVEIDGKQAYR